jgi:hypothetical protein
MEPTKQLVPVLKKTLDVTISIDYNLGVSFPLAIAELTKGRTPEELSTLTSKVKTGEELEPWMYAVCQLNATYKKIVDAAEKTSQVDFTEFSAESILQASGIPTGS